MLKTIASWFPVKTITVGNIPGSSEFIAIFIGFVLVQEGAHLDGCEIIHEQTHMVQILGYWVLVGAILGFIDPWAILTTPILGTLAYYLGWFAFGQDDSWMESQADKNQKECEDE